MTKRKRKSYRTRMTAELQTILPLMKRKAWSTAELVEHTGIDRRLISNAIYRERRLNTESTPIYIAEWALVKSGAWHFWRPRYRIGKKPDVPKPPRPPKPRVDYPAIALKAAIERALEEGGPATVARLAHELERDRRSIRTALNFMRDREGRVHISGYTRDLQPGRIVGRVAAVFALGSKKDAAHPGPMSAAETARRQRDKRRRVVSSVFQLGVPQHRKRLGSHLIP